MEKKDMWCCSLKVPIVIFAKGLQDDGDDCHDGFDNAELESRLENTLQFRMRHPKKKKIKDTVEKEEDEGWWGTSEPVCTQPLLTDRVSESLSPVVISHHNHYSDTYVEVNTWTCIHTIVKTCRCSEQIANLTYESLLHDSSWYKHLYTLFIQTLVRLSCILL